MTRHLDDVLAALPRCWEKRDYIRPANGQCVVSSLLIKDWFGGDLVRADVMDEDQETCVTHYWNQFAGGIWLDSTRSQFKLSQNLYKNIELNPPATEYLYRPVIKSLALLKEKVDEYIND